ncbi:unnamed protein product, partial [Adineta steineri]
FDINANSILNVSAVEKSTANKNKITITNDKGRLSKEEIECMITDAEKYKNEDEIRRDCNEAKRSLESYCFNIQTTINDQKLAEKMNGYDMKKMIDAIGNTLKWLEIHDLVEKEEFEYQLKEVDRICSPIMQEINSDKGGRTRKP